MNISVSQYMRDILEAKQKVNASYSLRAFAKTLQMSPGGLAQVMNGKKGFSLDKAHSIANILKMNAEEKKYFFLLIEFEKCRNPERKEEIYETLSILHIERMAEVYDLSLEQFRHLTNWYGLAILECISTYGKKFSEDQLAKHFGIPNEKVQESLERLTQMSLVTKTAQGSWKRCKDRLLISSNTSDENISTYYKAITEKAMASYEDQSPKERVTATEVFTFDKAQIDQVKKLTDEYLNKLLSLAKKGIVKNYTYQAVVNIFNLTNE